MSTNVVEERGRLGTRLARQLDADGKEIKFDVREDEEQNVKLQETTELLVAAGYFRARIKGLPAFDKVIGGMVWCISLCDVDVDVDLLYEENSTIGQKIKLTEKIVKVLSKMQCPSVIEPHQLQGLDFIHIFPVVQWLVKRAIIAREEVADAVQRFAEFQYHVLYQHQTSDKKVESTKMNEIQRSIAITPKRLYKRVDPVPLTEESKRVQSTLLEYGLGGIFNRMGKQITSYVGEQGDREGTEQIESLMTGMADVSDRVPKLPVAAISSAIGESGIREMAAKLADEFSDIRADYRLGTEQPSEVTVETLEGRKEELQATLSKVSTKYSELKQQIEDEQIRLEALQMEEKQMHEETHRLEKLAPVDESAVEAMNALLSQREEVKRRENEFKARCKAEVLSLESELDKLQQCHMQADETEETLKQLREKRDQAETTLSEVRLDAAAVNRQIAMLQRWIDDVPSHAELNQYQRRFLELYNQIANKHKETKQFYALFNTLQDVKAYMEKEVNLLNSIYDNYQLAMQSEQNKIQFLKQLEQSLESIKQSKLRFEKKEVEQQSKRDALREKHQELLDRQRLYYKTVKDFQEECKKHEIGTTLLREAGIME